MSTYGAESFYRGTIRQSISDTLATPFTLKVSKIPSLSSGLLTISPNTTNEEIIEYNGTNSTSLTITVVKRGISHSTQSLTTSGVDYNNTTYMRSHSQNDAIRGDVNHLHIIQDYGALDANKLNKSGGLRTGMPANSVGSIDSLGNEAFTPGGGFIMTGCITGFGGNTAPVGFLLCDGTAISRTTYSSLFSVLGTAYGVGDGSTTFNIPNLKGRVPVGFDSTQTEFDVLGEAGGEKTHVLTESEMPAHSHTSTAWNSSAYGGFPSACRNDNLVGGVSSNSTGGGLPHNNLQPYVVINYIIKT